MDVRSPENEVQVIRALGYPDAGNQETGVSGVRLISLIPDILISLTTARQASPDNLMS